MIINGFQKLTLLDFPEHTACTVFTGGCNLRCPFCHNAKLVLRFRGQPTIREEHILELLEDRVGLIDGVCVTGGEPTLQKDLPDFLKKIKDMGFLTKLDTNGTNPAMLKKLMDDGLLDYVAMDIKTSKERYNIVAGVPHMDIEPIEDSAKMLIEGNVPFEFRTTVVRQYHSDEDFESIGQWLAGAPRYFLQQFKDSGDLILNGLTGFNEYEMEQFLHTVRKYIPSAQLRGAD